MKYFFLFVSIFCIHKMDAQDSLHKEIKNVIVSEKKHETVFTEMQTINKNVQNQYQQNSLQQLLQLHTNVFVKNYGISTLSTISIRGCSAAQTAVNWNGLNINNATTGLADFSLLPVSLFDKIEINYSSSINNNAMSGGIVLENEIPVFSHQQKLKLAIGYESLQNKNTVFSYKYMDKKIGNTTQFVVNKSNNLYSFFNEDKNEIQKNVHSKSNQLAWMNDFFWKLSSKSIFSIHTWFQKNYREIPATTFENFSAKEETIFSIKNVVKWNFSPNKKWNFNTNVGTIYDNYSYQDSIIHLQSKIQSMMLSFSQKMNIAIKKNHLFSFQFFAKKSLLLHQNNNEIRTIGLSSYYIIDHILNRISLKLTAQKELTNLFSLPFVVSLSGNTKIGNSTNVYATISSNYRMPTLNELYYNPGGNVDLKPEKSKNIEAGIKTNMNVRSHFLNTDFAVYKRYVSNWIAWYGNAILTPHNIQVVESKGFEAIINYEAVLKKYISQKTNEKLLFETNQQKESSSLFKANFLYAYTLSTTKESSLPNDYSIGKQIPYVPRYQAKGSIGFLFKSFAVDFWQTYTGYRFVTTDESQYIMPYSTSNLFFSYSKMFKSTKISSSVKINNILNTKYESIVGRIMPTRNISIGLMFEFITN